MMAQLNESDTSKIRANLALTGVLQGGNVQTIIFRAKSEVSYRPHDKWVFKTTNSYVYQEFGQTKADEDILSLNFLYFTPEKKVYPLILAFASTNFRRAIDWRSLIGGGFTFNVYKKEKNWLKFSLTSEYEHTEFNNLDFNRDLYDGNQNINTFRGTLWVNGKYHIVKDRLIFGHESYFQPSLEDSNNYRWQADLSLQMPLWKWLNFNINYRHTFESIVVENQHEEDRFLTFGFTVKTY